MLGALFTILAHGWQIQVVEARLDGTTETTNPSDVNMSTSPQEVHLPMAVDMIGDELMLASFDLNYEPVINISAEPLEISGATNCYENSDQSNARCTTENPVPQRYRVIVPRKYLGFLNKQGRVGKKQCKALSITCKHSWDVIIAVMDIIANKAHRLPNNVKQSQESVCDAIYFYNSCDITDDAISKRFWVAVLEAYRYFNLTPAIVKATEVLSISENTSNAHLKSNDKSSNDSRANDQCLKGLIQKHMPAAVWLDIFYDVYTVCYTNKIASLQSTEDETHEESVTKTDAPGKESNSLAECNCSDISSSSEEESPSLDPKKRLNDVTKRVCRKTRRVLKRKARRWAHLHSGIPMNVDAQVIKLLFEIILKGGKFQLNTPLSLFKTGHELSGRGLKFLKLVSLFDVYRVSDSEKPTLGFLDESEPHRLFGTIQVYLTEVNKDRLIIAPHPHLKTSAEWVENVLSIFGHQITDLVIHLRVCGVAFFTDNNKKIVNLLATHGVQALYIIYDEIDTAYALALKNVLPRNLKIRLIINTGIRSHEEVSAIKDLQDHNLISYNFFYVCPPCEEREQICPNLGAECPRLKRHGEGRGYSSEFLSDKELPKQTVWYM